jgi:uncharacterized protein (DUF885 family)
MFSLSLPLSGCITEAPPFSESQDSNASGESSSQSSRVNTDGRDDEAPPASPRPVSEIADELFAYMLSSDYTLYNQLLAHPENFDIKKPPVDFGSILADEANDDKEAAYYHTLLQELKAYAGKELSAKDRRLCDYMVYYLSTACDMEPYALYWDPYMPSRGVHINAPLALMIFSFRTTQDIEDYLTLVEDIPRVLSEADEILETRTQEGFIPNTSSFESAIEEAEVYMADVEHNLLVVSFEKALHSDAEPFKSLSTEQRESYAKKNRELIKTQVVPAYEQTVELLEATKKQSSSSASIASYYPDYQEYYAASMRQLGFDTTPEEAIELIDQYLNVFLAKTKEAGGIVDGELLDKTASKTLDNDASKIIEHFNEALGKDFPDIGTRPFVVNAASDDEVMKNVLAFYLLAPVDELGDNKVVYYPQNIDTLTDLADTLAHESFPGHLYQYNYFGLTSPHPLEQLLGFTAYTEGYAVYSESFGYTYMGLDEKDAQSAAAYGMFLRLLQARLDLGVGYEGWDVEQTREYLDGWNLGGLAQDIFEETAAMSLVMLPYGLGPLKFHMMSDRAHAELGKSFDIKKFHEMILADGSVPFWLLEENFEAWLTKN